MHARLFTSPLFDLHLGLAVCWVFTDTHPHLPQVKDHARQLLEKHIRKPFFTAEYAGTFQRMEPEAVQAGLSWLDQRFHLIRYEVCL